MTIGQLSTAVGVAEHTLRYYEREGLMPEVPRDAGGRRVYTDLHRRWVEFLVRLRATGMPIRDVRLYVGCVERGADGERVEILIAHRARVRETLSQMKAHLALLDRKIAAGCGPTSADKEAQPLRSAGHDRHERPVSAPFLRFKAQSIAADDFAPHFPLEWMAKDLDLAVAALGADARAVPHLRSALHGFTAALAGGGGRLDFSAIAAPGEVARPRGGG